MLGADLAGVDPAVLPDDELVEVMAAWRRQASWAQAGELAAVAELARRRECGSSRNAEFTSAEVGLALGLSPRSADGHTALAVALAERLPLTRQALGEGRIDFFKARVIAQGTAAVDAGVAAAVEGRVLARACGQTPGRVRVCVERAVMALDPGGAERRRRACEAERRVDCHDTGNGTAVLSGVHLPAGPAIAADNRLHAIAAAMKADGDPRTLAQLSADVFVSLLLGVRPATASPSSASSGPASSGTAFGPASPGPASPGPASRGPASSGPASPGPASSGPASPGPASPGPASPGPASRGPASSGPGSSGLALSGRVSPGSASRGPASGGPALSGTASFGPGASGTAFFDATPDRGSGTGHDGGDTRHGRSGDPSIAGPGDDGDPRFPVSSEPVSSEPVSSEPVSSEPVSSPVMAGDAMVRAVGRRIGTVQLTVPLCTLLGLSAEPGAVAGYGPLTAEVARQMAGAASDPKTRWCVTVTGPGGEPVHHGHLGYRPPAQMAHLIRILQPTCAFPGCGRPATACDLDHRIPYDRGGATCPCNMNPLCRRHHRAKQADGWHLTEHDGRLRWTTPAGKTYEVPPHASGPDTTVRVTTGDPPNGPPAGGETAANPLAQEHRRKPGSEPPHRHPAGTDCPLTADG